MEKSKKMSDEGILVTYFDEKLNWFGNKFYKANCELVE